MSLIIKLGSYKIFTTPLIYINNYLGIVQLYIYFTLHHDTHAHPHEYASLVHEEAAIINIA